MNYMFAVYISIIGIIWIISAIVHYLMGEWYALPLAITGSVGWMFTCMSLAEIYNKLKKKNE